jgi:hypothetical protein
MQNPTSEEGAIIKREWWNGLGDQNMDSCTYITSYNLTIQHLVKKESADFSAITTWGVFYKSDDSGPASLILLDCHKERWEFPELRRSCSRAI